MHLQSCLHPKRVYNKYTNEFVWVACRECEACRNARAAKWTTAIERERKVHRYTLFVTLTYAPAHLPILDFGSWNNQCLSSDSVLIPSKGDDFTLEVSDFETLFEDTKDKELFNGFFEYYGGIPYCSAKDLQNFHKRLNKYIHDKFTNKFENFRYFVCSEYGSSCFRPHFHGIYYVDDSEVAEHFAECVLHTWRQGNIDCQYVEKSAGAYVAQYVNKSADLPRFYKTGKIRQKFFFSRFPIIGDVLESGETLQEIFDSESCTVLRPSHREPNKLVSVPLPPGIQNRLYPKCFSFGSVSDSTRIALYRLNSQFSVRSPKELMHKLWHYIHDRNLYSEFDFLIYEVFKECDTFTNRLFDFVKRLYYISRRFLHNCSLYSLSEIHYLERIKEFWSKKELSLLKEFYTFQELYSRSDSDSLVLMYPEFAYQHFNHDETFKVIKDMYRPLDLWLFEKDSINFHVSNHLTHDKNAYLDKKILQSDNPFIYKLIKNYFYAKKCNEVGKAFATSCA